VANSVEAANILAELTGKPRELCQHVQRRLGEAGLIHRGSRGRSAQPVTAREIAIMLIALMATTDGTTPAVQIPRLAERIANLDDGSYPEISLMDLSDVTGVTGETRQLRAFGSFVETLAKAIEGYENPKRGPVQALGLQFCRGNPRAWVEWKLTGKVFFGVRELPPGMIQEAVINTGILDALRQIPTKTPSVAADGSKTTTPAQFAAGSASVVSSESPRDANRDAPLVHRQNMREYSRERVINQLDSGTDSPSPNRFSSEREPDGQHSRHRCFADAQH